MGSASLLNHFRANFRGIHAGKPAIRANGVEGLQRDGAAYEAGIPLPNLSAPACTCTFIV